MSVILLDIEGTTTPITFVYDELFPFARAHMRAYVLKHGEEARFEGLLAQLRVESAAERAAGFDAPAIPEGTDASALGSAADFALWQMAHDRKATGLKELQGWIWRSGYEGGELRGVVYEDVPQAIARWREAGHRVAIYSSGSVEAQTLIFGYSTAGDLRPQLDAYFDTTTGPKKEAESYRKIASALAVEPKDVVFCSDNLDEIRAADAAGMQTRLTVRPGNAPVEAHDFQVITSFDAEDIGF